MQHDLTIGIFQRFRKVKLSKRTALFNEKMDNQTDNFPSFL